MALSEIPRPSGSIALDRAESAASETLFRSFRSAAMLFFTNSTVRLRLRSYTFSLSHGRSLDGTLDLDVDSMLFIPPVRLDLIHFRQFVVAVPHQLFHPFGL